MARKVICIFCPKCKSPLNEHELGIYTCIKCNVAYPMKEVSENSMMNKYYDFSIPLNDVIGKDNGKI